MARFEVDTAVLFPVIMRVAEDPKYAEALKAKVKEAAADATKAQQTLRGMGFGVCEKDAPTVVQRLYKSWSEVDPDRMNFGQDVISRIACVTDVIEPDPNAASEPPSEDR